MTHPASIYCVSHRPVPLDHTGICTLQVGHAQETFCDFRDNTSVNIATHNSVLSELTAHYWVWQNQPSEIVGFCHYRRYLLPESSIEWLAREASQPYAELPPGGFGLYASGYVTEQSALGSHLTAIDYAAAMADALQDADILLPAPNKLPADSFLGQYSRAHPVEPFYSMLAAIAKRDNDLGKAAHHFFTTHEQAHWNNLYVTRWNVFHEFCEFQFDILLTLLKEDRTFPDAYQNRYGAFLSERLFNFWIWHRKLNVKQLPWCMTEAIEDGNDAHQRKIQSKNRENMIKKKA